MSQSALADSWYRIATLRPRLRPHARIRRQVQRGQLWYVLQDHQTGRFFRVSPSGNLTLCLMDGRRTMQEIWDIIGRRLGAERPPQDEVVQLLAQLHQADLVHAESAPDMAELERRAQRRRHWTLIAALRSPMAVRIPLLDPDRFLAQTLPFVRPLFSVVGFILWAALVGVGAVLAAMHWSELTANTIDRVLAADNIFLLAITYPVVKALHEFGHAYATKVRGGEVHEMGIMLLVFLPVPYVDASGSSAFPARSHRALVGAAGIMVELALSALAMIAWLEVDFGFVHAVAFNVMLIGGISTLLFNGNPLLRFDGYYVLSDLIEIPNLDARSKRYLLYLIQSHVLGLEHVDSPVQGPGEHRWFIAYGIASFLYRTSVTLGIALYVTTKFFVIGIMLALWSMVQLIILPLIRALRYLASSQQLNGRRRRAAVTMCTAVAAIAVLLFAVPMPYATVADGVVWVPDADILRAGGEGFVLQLLATPDSDVVADQPLIRLEDPVAAAQVQVKQAELEVLQHRYTAVNQIDLVQARLIAQQLARAQAALERAKQRQGELVIRAPRAGRFVVPDARELVGEFEREGDLLGYVIGPDDIGIRVVIPQAEIDPVRQRVRSVAVRLTEQIDRTFPATIVRYTPAALDRPPAPALSPEGGGPMLLDPSNPKQQRPLDEFYEIELKLVGTTVGRIGGHVFARFDQGSEPLAWRGLRALRQLFLRVVHV